MRLFTETKAYLCSCKRILCLHLYCGAPHNQYGLFCARIKASTMLLLLLLSCVLQATLAAMAMATASQQQQPITHPTAAAAAAAAASCGPCPPMEAVVSLAMYLTELALLDADCCALPGSTIATAALLLAHTTLAGHCGAWQLVLTAAGSSAAQVQPAVAALQRLHAAAAAAPASAQLAELLLPLKAKFGQDCWCRVAAEVTPLDMQQAAAAAAAASQAPNEQQQQVLW
jgi:hypothetical protein